MWPSLQRYTGHLYGKKIYTNYVIISEEHPPISSSVLFKLLHIIFITAQYSEVVGGCYGRLLWQVSMATSAPSENIQSIQL